MNSPAPTTPYFSFSSTDHNNIFNSNNTPSTTSSSSSPINNNQLLFTNFNIKSSSLIVESEIVNPTGSSELFNVLEYAEFINQSIRKQIETESNLTGHDSLIHTWCIQTVMIRLGLFTNENIGLVKRVGSGGFGSVYRIAKDRVLKICKDSEAIKKFDHPNLLKIERVFSCACEKLLMIVSPFYELGHLDNNDFTLAQYWSLLLNLTTGLKYLHSQQVVHRDIKPENILLESVEYNNVKVVLSDFGLARSYQSLSSGSSGTFYYLAPELIQDGKSRFATVKSDVYSLGKTISVLILKGKLKRLRFEFKSNINPLTDLLNRMMKEKPENRPTTDEIIEECNKQIVNLVEQDYTVQFSLKRDSLAVFEYNDEYGCDDDDSCNDTEDVSNSLQRMVLDDSQLAKRAYQIGDKIMFLSESSVKTDPMSISSENFSIMPQLPTSTLHANSINNNGYSYKFVLHEHHVVNAKKIIQIKCTPEARNAIQSIYLRIYNSKSSTDFINVTPNLSNNSIAGLYSISNSQKQCLIPSTYEKVKGKDYIELYINNTSQYLDTASYVAKNK